MRARFSSPLSRLTFCAALALSASACMRGGSGDIVSSVPASALSETEWREQADRWGKRVDAAPGDRDASINYARALRAIGQREQAVAVLEQAAARQPNDLQVLGAYGKALADAGRLREALDILGKAHLPEKPDWRILSAMGVVSDKLGEHEAAQRYYQAALNIAPGEPSILSNLGFSYALARRLPEAEATLRQAAEGAKNDPRIRQNLVLVLGLQGKFDEAEKIARTDLPAEDVRQNMAYLKSMISQPNNWAKIKQTMTR
ncbi:MAG: hypothetical protein BGP06_01100 [Rhizobiales bacterium 65-9]|nr:tetratricopeptide repeat protein [Hyphomicrobiales bacterium]OJY37346.1 MAG: hypothetical protein BGP06_01100 [Rhizobiales bacterium 65-9]